MYGFLGHVGDGNFHIFLPVNDEHFDRLKEISNSVALRKALEELSKQYLKLNSCKKFLIVDHIVY